MTKFYTSVDQIGSQFMVRGYDNGKRVEFRTDEYRPTLFLESKDKTEYVSLEGKYLKPIQPGNVRACREFIEQYESVANFKIYGNTRYTHQFIADNYPGSVDFDMSLIQVMTLDIEVASENGFPDPESCAEEVLCISLQDNTSKKITTFGSRPFLCKQENVTYIECSDEENLLRRFIGFWMKNTPDIVTGWNCEKYDMPYLVRRLEKVIGTYDMKKLSPWNTVAQREVLQQGRPYISIELGGISIIDYLDLYKKFTYTNQESYRLDHIAEVELGENKLDHSEYDTFKEFYTNNWQKFVEYNIRDVELVDRLEDKMKLIELINVMAYDAKCTTKDVFSQVKTWDAIIYNYLRERGIVIPFAKSQEKNEKYAGAYVKEPIPGKYEWVVSFDLNSLYPHIIMQYNISPETLLDKTNTSVTIDKMLNKAVDLSDLSDYAICPNGAMYRKDIRGFLPELMEKLYLERTTYKKKMLAAEQEYENTKDPKYLKLISRFNNFQMARKIQLNSAYGAIGNNFFRYYRLENAEAITKSGQLATRWIENHLNGYLNNILNTSKDYVIASDTDSIYLNLGEFVDKIFKGKDKPSDIEVVKFLDKVCDGKLQTFIDNSYQELADYTNAYDQKMIMKREAIAKSGIWLGKKRYILHVWNSEGVQYQEPKVKMKGIEAVKSSTPKYCRSKIKEAINVILTQDEIDLRKFVKQCRKEFLSLPVEDIASPRSVTDIDKWSDRMTIFKKRTPMHVRAALLFNHYIKKNKLDKKYSPIANGEKIKYIYLKTPNPIHENTIGFIIDFPKELGLDPYIDRELQFEKSFLNPISMICHPLRWSIETVNNVRSLFG